ncbi:UNVERIFIED_CONTAM: hypothetical protein Slati_3116400 [Sesamum latifolium]|uniref:Peptidase S9 prolyl oligopeptidase catalytic domain-containing protein n=1 Tax=Sesamum latifolium TaxID=2727402 RepID=A0AAW2UVH6_9LAMI
MSVDDGHCGLESRQRARRCGRRQVACAGMRAHGRAGAHVRVRSAGSAHGQHTDADDLRQAIRWLAQNVPGGQ